MAMKLEDQARLTAFYNELSDRPLEPDDPLYEPLDKGTGDSTAVGGLRGQDCVGALLSTIVMSQSETCQLFSGFRGSGKSTELRRLRDGLRKKGYLVLLCDAVPYMNLSSPLDITDLLVVLAGALGDLVREETGEEVIRQSYWRRFLEFARRTKISVDEMEVGVGVGDDAETRLKASFKSDPTFKQRVQERLAGHLGSLVKDANLFVAECAAALRAGHPDAEGFVFLVDSLEQLRGTTANAEAVYKSVDEVFGGHAEKLRMPGFHVVYSVPPYLKVMNPGVAALYSGPVRLLPMTKLWGRDPERPPVEAGIAALTRLVQHRGELRKIVPNADDVRKVVQLSGGYIRDLVRIFQEAARLAMQADRLPVDGAMIDAAVAAIRRDYQPILKDDADWLARVANTRDCCIGDVANVRRIAKLFDSHVVLSYQNDDEWYDVHPLIRDHVLGVAALSRGRSVW
ncbi:MAG: AAA family ATPase [Myxococcota bacterium]|nr:AAA family ATPase [Myxococcota bacterium]